MTPCFQLAQSPHDEPGDGQIYEQTAASNFIAEQALEAELAGGPKLTVVALGPLTNLATAFRLHPDLPVG